MNKNLILAFAIILASIFFFNSNFYYHTLLGRPHPDEVAREKLKREALQKQSKESSAEPGDTLAPKEKMVPALQPAQPVPPPYPPSPGLQLKHVVVESPLYTCTIDRKGGRIVSWKLKGFHPLQAKDPEEIADLIPASSQGAVNAWFNGQNLDSLPFVCVGLDSLDTLKTISAGDSLKLTFACRLGTGEMEKEFVFHGSEYKSGLTIRKRNMGAGKLRIGWLSGIHSIDFDPAKISSMQSGPGGYEGYLLYGEDVEQAGDFKNEQREYTGSVRWAGVKIGYFGCALILDSVRDASVVFHQKIQNKVPLQMSYSVEEDFEREEIHYEIFAGPLKFSTLKSYGMRLEGIIFQGWRFLWAYAWFPPLCGFVLWLLNFFYRLLPDYGFAIVLLTVVSRVVTIPLTLKSTKSMAAMKDLQPKVNEIRKRLKAEPMKMNQEIMKLYKKQGVNPMGAGCLPMVLQMPIFIALFVALRKAVELRAAESFVVPWAGDLSQPDVILHMGFSLPFYGEGVCVLPLLNAVVTFFQNKMTIKDPNQKMMIYFMPVFFLFLFNAFPAGLNLYWTLSTFLGIVQQWVMERRKKKNPQAVNV